MKAREGFLGLLISAGLAARSVAGELLESTTPDAVGFAGGAGAAAWRLGAALVFVLGLILLLQRIARRYGHGLSTASAAPIELLTQRSMGTRVSLAVVRVMGKTLLVSVSPQGVQRVTELTPDHPRDPLPVIGDDRRTLAPRIGTAKTPTRTPGKDERVNGARFAWHSLIGSFRRRFPPRRIEVAPAAAPVTARPAAQAGLPNVAPPMHRARTSPRFSHELDSRLKNLERYPSLRDLELEEDLAGGNS